jgi:mono/diheme cytochrome c family protein
MAILSRITRRTCHWLIGLSIVFVVGIVGFSLGFFGSGPARIDRKDAAQVARGKAIYEQHCLVCHGKELEGQPEWQSRNAQGRLPAPPHDDSGHTWHHDDSVLLGITKFGVAKFASPGYESDMPAFEGRLSDAEIAAVLAYIKSRWSPAVHAKRRAAKMD